MADDFISFIFRDFLKSISQLLAFFVSKNHDIRTPDANLTGKSRSDANNLGFKGQVRQKKLRINDS